MFGKKYVGTLIASIALIAAPAFSQSEDPGKNEVSAQAFGSFVKSTTSNGVDQTATNSGGVLASYRYFFTNHHGVEVNYGYALNTQAYALTTGALGVKSGRGFHDWTVRDADEVVRLRDEELVRRLRL